MGRCDVYIIGAANSVSDVSKCWADRDLDERVHQCNEKVVLKYRSIERLRVQIVKK